jgi:hypothetical protein
MFKNVQFYHSHIKKAIIAFGTIFTNINVIRRNEEDDIAQVLRVPLAYSSKQKFLSRIAALPDAETSGRVQIILPRIGFEISGLVYDPARKLSPIQRNSAIGEGDNVNTVRSSFVSTPYNLSMSLYVLAKNQEDGLQIIEQILPYFNPDFNVTINELPELNIKRDIKIILDSVGYEDIYEGDYKSKQSIIWTLNFTMKINFFGSVANTNVIKQAIASVYSDTSLETRLTKTTVSVGINGTVDTTLTPADTYDFITELLESFQGDNVE